MRFVHSSDWQIGKTFNFADDDVLRVLQAERLDAITRLGALARREGAADILVAGDIYDYEAPSDRTLRQPLERMRSFPDLRWHLIPGNHDFHAVNGVWDRVRRIDLPANVRTHLETVPALLADGVWLLPSVLTRRHVLNDPTDWMDGAATPEGAVRIGLAHGSVREFGGQETAQPNLIAFDRPERAGLAYLALGDWHGFSRIGERCAYSGTPEADGFDKGGDGGGSALVVSLDGPNAPPAIEKHRIGRFTWRREQATLNTPDDIAALENRLRSLAPEQPDTLLVWLTAEGHLTLGDMSVFEERILGNVGAALRFLRIETTPELIASADDLTLFSEAGVVSRAASRLQTMSAAPGPRQQDALLALRRLASFWRSERRA